MPQASIQGTFNSNCILWEVLSKFVHKNIESRKSATATASAVCLIAATLSFGMKTRNSAPIKGRNVIRVKNI